MLTDKGAGRSYCVTDHSKTVASVNFLQKILIPIHPETDPGVQVNLAWLLDLAFEVNLVFATGSSNETEV